MTRIKSIFAAPLIRFIKNSVANHKDIRIHRRRYLLEKAIGRKEKISYIPDIFAIAITFQCTLRCPTCTYLLKDKQVFEGKKEMTLKDFNWILERFKEDIRIVTISGGEPTLHSQFSEIVRSIKERNFRLEMPTNGTLIKERINDLKYFDKLSVSLDGVDYQTFKKIRNGTQKQYNDIIAGIYLLRDAGIPFHLCFLLFEENLSEIKRILDFAREVRPTLLKFNSFNPHGCQSQTPLIIDRPAVQNFLKEILKNDDYPFSIRLPIIFNPNSKFFYQKNCPLLWSSAYIGWKGDIAPCCHIADDPKIGNIFQHYNFNSRPIVEFRKTMIEHKLSPDCLYCQTRFSENYTGDFDAKKKKWIFSLPYQKQKILSKIYNQ